MKYYLKFLSALMYVLLLLPLFGCGGSGDITTAEQEDTTAPEQTPAPVETTLTPETTEAPAPADEWTALREKANGEGIKVLFIGDSLTHYNEMPQIFAGLCKAAGKKVTADRQTKGGTGIAMYREDPALWKTVSDKIASDKWDIIVYQPNRNNPEKNITFANLGDKAPADGFDTEPVSRALTIGRDTGNNTKAAPKATAPKQTATAPKKGLDLDALLG